MNYATCVKCGAKISNNNIAKHLNGCSGLVKYYKRPGYVKGVRKTSDKLYQFDWPEIQSYYDAGHSTVDCFNKFGASAPYISRASKLGLLKLRTRTETKCLTGRKNPSAKTRKKLSDNAKRRGFGGYNPNAGHSKKFSLQDSYGKMCVLQSSYELRFATLLNGLSIKWLRPPHLKYGSRKYFADFYLPDYDVFFDTKNEYLIRVDAEKIRLVRLHNQINLFVVSNANITKDFILGCLKLV